MGGWAQKRATPHAAALRIHKEAQDRYTGSDDSPYATCKIPRREEKLLAGRAV